MSTRSSGRGRLPTWVVRIRSVLSFISHFHVDCCCACIAKEYDTACCGAATERCAHESHDSAGQTDLHDVHARADSRRRLHCALLLATLAPLGILTRDPRIAHVLLCPRSAAGAPDVHRAKALYVRAGQERGVQQALRRAGARAAGAPSRASGRLLLQRDRPAQSGDDAVGLRNPRTSASSGANGCSTIPTGSRFCTRRVRSSSRRRPAF